MTHPLPCRLPTASRPPARQSLRCRRPCPTSPDKHHLRKHHPTRTQRGDPMTDNTATQPHESTDDLTVTTTHGAVGGIMETGVRTRRGIPYAAPPVGDLRLRAPEPATPWQG